jgi:hypothetical protein
MLEPGISRTSIGVYDAYLKRLFCPAAEAENPFKELNLGLNLSRQDPGMLHEMYSSRWLG